MKGKGVRASPPKVYLTVGLGNPGPRYRNTRHNVGFKVIDLWGDSLGVGLTGRRFHSRNGRALFRGRDIILVRPLTFMNLSGACVKAFAEYHNLDPPNILVVHDDLDLPVGRIKVARQGGAGGHKGVQSIIHHLGTNAFPRARIGIGRPRYTEPVEEYVLSPFYGDEKDTMEKVAHMAVRACEVFVSEGVEAAMHYANSQHLGNKEGMNLCRD